MEEKDVGQHELFARYFPGKNALAVVFSFLLVLTFFLYQVSPQTQSLIVTKISKKENLQSTNVVQEAVNEELTLRPSLLELSKIDEVFKSMGDISSHQSLENVTEDLIKIAIENQRSLIEIALANYTFHPAAKVKSYDQLLLSNGGKPIRNMVVTTWRSGSTFLGDLMQSHPSSFYHYEPLLPYGITTIRGGPMSKAAIRDLRKLMNCDFYDMDHYIKFGEESDFLFRHNEHVWKFCERFFELCKSPKFLSQLCLLFPFQNIKTVRLPANLTEEFLHNSSAQILLLVRDPRGTLQSRLHRTWCPGSPDCSDPKRLCKDLVNDYHSAKKLLQKYPKSFKVIRYEDMSLDIYNKSRELFDFFHLSFHPNVEKFLDTHTKEHKGGVSSTFRDSKTAPFHWRTELIWQEVVYIQNICSEAMQLWGYEFALNRTSVRTFNPLGKFNFP